MLTVDQAQELAGIWRDRFDDPEAFTTSWSRYFDHYKHNRSPESLEAWLKADAEQDEVRAVGITREPLLPTRQDFGELVDDCATCRGKRWVRHDVPIGHVDFGQAFRCPACGGHPTRHPIIESSEETKTDAERNQCFKCNRFEDEPAGERCGNPPWHWPNWSAPVSGDAQRDYVAELARQWRASA